MLFDQNMIIDATRGSIARFVNPSSKPNCKMDKWTVAGKPRMAQVAGEQGIMTGEELTYDYNFEYVVVGGLVPEDLLNPLVHSPPKTFRNAVVGSPHAVVS